MGYCNKTIRSLLCEILSRHLKDKKAHYPKASTSNLNIPISSTSSRKSLYSLRLGKSSSLLLYLQRKKIQVLHMITDHLI